MEFEIAYKLTLDDAGKRPLVTDLAKSAFDAGKLEQARRWATTLVNQSERDWNYGNAIHQGHLILGRLALMDGNVQQAKEELIAAGNTPGSPQLNSFGPNMTLAKELLEKANATRCCSTLNSARSFGYSKIGCRSGPQRLKAGHLTGAIWITRGESNQ